MLLPININLDSRIMVDGGLCALWRVLALGFARGVLHLALALLFVFVCFVLLPVIVVVIVHLHWALSSFLFFGCKYTGAPYGAGGCGCAGHLAKHIGGVVVWRVAVKVKVAQRGCGIADLPFAFGLWVWFWFLVFGFWFVFAICMPIVSGVWYNPR
jgi:hypothetical protein